MGNASSARHNSSEHPLTMQARSREEIDAATRHGDHQKDHCKGNRPKHKKRPFWYTHTSASEGAMLGGGQECPAAATVTNLFLFKNEKEQYRKATLVGSFNNWEKIPMRKCGEEFAVSVQLGVGSYEYKFLVDGRWRLQNGCLADEGEVDKITVCESDFDADLALDDDEKHCPDGDTSATEPHASWGQIIPPYNSHHSSSKHPVMIPGSLANPVLNQQMPCSAHPEFVAEPTNHTIMRHLYSLTIHDAVMGLSSTHRYRNKFVTTILYKPFEPLGNNSHKHATTSAEVPAC
ncbi:unnamed protein product [Notodromas monacha]|uniref:5'-AMP-activated protein kinase subunit beta-1 n=1 Tax=Notodromas monacha TaxID=399045 RepID=A0A7R9BMU6_9CRUS|nr:unnamed protein product [Notodromas monacha]CAG0918405.1 unnamed protein product [Notodromas monacha]